MFDTTAIVVFETPRGEQRYLRGVKSVTTRDDGTMDVAVTDRHELIEVGWDHRMRDVWVGDHKEAFDPEKYDGPY